MAIIYIGNFLSRHGINPTYSELLVQKLCLTGLKVIVASHKLTKVLRMLDMIWTMVRNRKRTTKVVIDLYSGAHAIIYAQVVSRLAFLSRLPFILVLHGGGLPDLLDSNPSKIVWLIKEAQTVIAPSEYLANAFSNFRKTIIIPNAIDVDLYNYSEKKEVGPRLLFLRSFHKWTRPQDAILCLNEVKKQHSDATLTMAGWDEDGTLEECMNLVEDLDLKDSVQFVGRLPKSEIYKLSVDHDIFLHTMLVDNFPITLLEAMALGLSIVATNVGGIPSLLKNGETALIVQPGDYIAMAEAVLFYISNPDETAEMRQQARLTVENYSWKNVIPIWQDLLT